MAAESGNCVAVNAPFLHGYRDLRRGAPNVHLRSGMNGIRVFSIPWMVAGLVASTGCSVNATVSGSSCGIDSAVGCPVNFTGWSCSGSERPEDRNGDLVCNTDGAGDFCCASSTCAFDSSVPCSQGAGFSCPIGSAPDDSDPSLVCSIPSASGNEDLFCCFTATATSGATCAQDDSVVGCEDNSFGFSCTGSDRPDADFSDLTCSASGTPGTDAAGNPATLFCCTSP